MRRPALLLSLLALSACLPADPTVVDYNGASVKVQTNPYAENGVEAAQPAATDICRRGGKRSAEYASTRENPQTGFSEHLFLCL